MKIRTLIAAAALAFTSSVAFANHCPKDMAAIDAALAKNPSLSADKLTAVKQLRADGEAMHKAGKHTESMDSLGKAMKILGI